MKTLLITILIGLQTQAAEFKCPENEKYLISAPIKKFAIHLCGWEDKKIISEFNIYSEDSAHKVQKIKSAGALEHYKIKKDTNGMSLTELTYFIDDYIPTFKSNIICNDQRCYETQKKCVFKKQKTRKSMISEKTIKALTETPVHKRSIIDDATVQRIADLALTGNKTALEFFLQVDTSGLLDGASGEVHMMTSQLLTRFKEAKCF